MYNNINKIIVLMVLIIFLMIFTTSATYAYLAVDARDTSTISGNVASAGLTLSVTRIAPTEEKLNSSTRIMVPQLNKSLESAINDTNKCIDNNHNVVCQIYKIDITNVGTSSVNLRGSVFFDFSDNFDNLYWTKLDGPNTLGENTIYKATTNSRANYNIVDYTNATLVNNLSLVGTDRPGNKSTTYYIVVWINEVNYVQNNIDSGTWTMNVSFDDANGNKGITSTINI